jgi:hypothetical protein
MARNSAGPPFPAGCTPIGNSSVSDLTCTSASDSQAGSEFKCNNGFYLKDNAAPTADTCEPCSPIANSNNQGLRCNSATDTQAFGNQFQCTPGYYLVDNEAPAADTCGKCPGMPNSNNEGITCGAGGLNPIGDPSNGFECTLATGRWAM